jgi:O-succinylbenzoic acid--CoA ligase
MATSGSTGRPKGVVLTHAAVAASARATSARLGVDPAQHRWVACLPLNHIGGLSVIARALVTGTPFEVHDGFDAARVAAASGPDVLVSLVDSALGRLDAALFRTVVLGGAAPPACLPANVVTTYGLTETGSGLVYDGSPLDGAELRISATGEIWVRGPMLMRAYRDGSRPFDRDGWFPTGDAGHLDEAGKLHVTGRLSEMIITGGENVWPAAVEAVLGRHPAVAEVAVGGRPDPEWGERVVAYVVPHPDKAPPALAELKALVRAELAAYAAPKELVLVPSLPRTAIGKLRRDALTGPTWEP